jgi:formate dehydrogenase iron-sulfur subunit
MAKIRFSGGDEGIAVIVDLDKCIGCRACQIACQEWNGRKPLKTSFSPTFTNPPDLHSDAWKIVFFYEFPVTRTLRFPETEVSVNTVDVISVPFNCLHCTNPPCARTCPAEAIKVSPEGAVVQDWSRCIGCGRCLQVCPYNVPRRGSDGKYYKCTFCIDRIQNGLKPACVETCPVGVFTFTTMSEAVEIASKLEAEGKKVYGLNLDSYVGGKVRWVYVTSKDKAEKVYPLRFPEIPTISEVLKDITIPGLSVTAILALALIALSWWRARRTASKSE